MPACENTLNFPGALPPKLLACFALLTAISLLSACKDGSGKFGFELESAEARVSGQQLKVRLEQDIRLSPEARTALENGVALHIVVQAELEDADIDTKEVRLFEIHYLPLSDHYQLNASAGPGPSVNSSASSSQTLQRRTFPRLRHALAEISTVELDLPIAGLQPGTYQLRARTSLDKQELPAPMRLPAWFSPNWQLDSGWKSWPITVPAAT